MGRSANPDDRDGDDSITVNERRSASYSRDQSARSDAISMTDTPPPTARWGQEAPETIRVAAAEDTVPNIRRSVRSAADVDRERGGSRFGLIAIAVIVAIVVLVALVGGAALLAVTFVPDAPPPPVEAPEPEAPTDLEGVPVRKGLGQD